MVLNLNLDGHVRFFGTEMEPNVSGRARFHVTSSPDHFFDQLYRLHVLFKFTSKSIWATSTLSAILGLPGFSHFKVGVGEIKANIEVQFFQKIPFAVSHNNRRKNVGIDTF